MPRFDNGACHSQGAFGSTPSAISSVRPRIVRLDPRPMTTLREVGSCSVVLFCCASADILNAQGGVSAAWPDNEILDSQQPVFPFKRSRLNGNSRSFATEIKKPVSASAHHSCTVTSAGRFVTVQGEATRTTLLHGVEV
jgi:hypothetical protein